MTHLSRPLASLTLFAFLQSTVFLALPGTAVSFTFVAVILEVLFSDAWTLPSCNTLNVLPQLRAAGCMFPGDILFHFCKSWG